MGRICIWCGVADVDRKQKYCGDGSDKENEHYWVESHDPKAVRAAALKYTERLGVEAKRDERNACMGMCGKILGQTGMCSECIEGARILNRNAMAHQLRKAARECEKYAIDQALAARSSGDFQVIALAERMDAGKECAARILALIPNIANCMGCSIEAEIGTEENPHPVPKRFHSCATPYGGKSEVKLAR